LSRRVGGSLGLLALAAALVVPGAASPRGVTAQTIEFAGKGNRTLRPFRLSVGSTLTWHNTGTFFGLAPRTRTFNGAVASTLRDGTSFLPRGRYVLNVVARGAWSMTIRPGVEPIERSGGALVFEGNGRKALPPFRVRKNSYMDWKSPGGLFQLYNTTSSAGAVATRERAGTSYLPPGNYRFVVVNARGNWSLRVR
jgi:hypothetical protein